MKLIMENWRKFTLSESKEEMLAKILTWGEANLTKEVQEGQGFISMISTEKGALKDEKISRYKDTYLWKKSNPNDNNAKVEAFKSLYQYHSGITNVISEMPYFPVINKHLKYHMDQIKKTIPKEGIREKYKDLSVFDPAASGLDLKGIETGGIKKEKIYRGGSSFRAVSFTKVSGVIPAFARVDYDSIVQKIEQKHEEAIKDLKKPSRPDWKMISKLENEKISQYY